MTPEEKAKELADNFKAYADDSTASLETNAYYCASLAVDEIIKSNELENYPKLKHHVDALEHTSDDEWVYNEKKEYWEKVKNEIEKL